MILSDIELTKLKDQLEKLKVYYQGNGADNYSNDITFVRSIIEKISVDLTDVNKVIYNKIGNNGYINKIYAGGKLVFYYDKYHTLICDVSLLNHIGDTFEYNVVNMSDNTTVQSTRTLIKAIYTDINTFTNIVFV